MGNKGSVSVEFTLLFVLLVVPTFMAAQEVAPVINTWIEELRASIQDGEAILDALENAT